VTECDRRLLGSYAAARLSVLAGGGAKVRRSHRWIGLGQAKLPGSRKALIGSDAGLGWVMTGAWAGRPRRMRCEPV
jgi:hypothetical protein